MISPIRWWRTASQVRDGRWSGAGGCCAERAAAGPERSATAPERVPYPDARPSPQWRAISYAPGNAVRGNPTIDLGSFHHGSDAGAAAESEAHEPCACGPETPHRRTSSRLVGPAPRDRRRQLAADRRRRLRGRPASRHQQHQQLRPGPGRPGRADTERAGRAAAGRRERAHPGPLGRPDLRGRPGAAADRAAGRRRAQATAARRHRHPVAVHQRRARQRPVGAGHVQRRGQTGQRRHRGGARAERGGGDPGPPSGPDRRGGRRRQRRPDRQRR